jgi:hypothetical protein
MRKICSGLTACEILNYCDETALGLTQISGLSIVDINEIDHTFLRDCEH